MFKGSFELAGKLLEGQEEKDDFQQRFRELVQEIFEERLKALEKIKKDLKNSHKKFLKLI